MSVIILLSALNTFSFNNAVPFNRKSLTSSIIPDNKRSSLTGNISSGKDGSPVEGASIYIPDLKSGTLSDSTGYYKLKNLPKARLLVQVSCIGFKSVVMTMDFAEPTTRDFIMEPTITEIDEMIITGTSRSTEIKRNPIPVAVMDRKNIDQVNGSNIIDIVAKMPGINAVTTGPNIAKPFIHGLGFNRVLTLVDGIRHEGQQWGDEHGIEVDENAVNKVEIVKGPASLIYGSDALAGVINLIPYPSVSSGELKGSFISSYQTNNKLVGSSVAVDANRKDGFIWGGRLSHKMATNYKNKYDGRVYGTSFAETDANGYAGLNKNWGYSNLNLSVYNDLQMIPDGSRDSLTRRFTKQITEADLFRPVVSDTELNSYKIGAMHQHVQHYKIYSSNTFILGENKIALTLGYQRNIRQEFSHPEEPSIPGLHLVLNTLTYDLKYYFPDVKGLETTIGINGMVQQNKNRGTEFIIPDYRQFDAGPFLHIKKNLEKFDISGGLRFDSRFFSNDEMFVAKDPVTGFDKQVNSSSNVSKEQIFTKYTRTFTGLSYSIGASYSVNENLTVKVNVARGFRAPNISEISANGVHPGTNIYQIGNLNFKPEFSLQEDIGIIYSHRYIKANMELFNADINNYIFNQKVFNHLGVDSVIVNGNETFKFQQARAHLCGGEISIDIHPHPFDWLHFENSLSFVYATNKGVQGIDVPKDAKYLPFIPPLHTNSELRADVIRKFKSLSTVYFKVEMVHYARQNRAYLIDNTETITPGYTLFNAGFGADLLNNKRKAICSLHVSGNNMFDVAYQSHMSRLKYFGQYPDNFTGRRGIYDMGRNIGIKLLFPIGR